MVRKAFLLFVLALIVPTSIFSQWVQTSGPSLGGINEFYDHNDTIYAATGAFTQGSVVRSTDHGLSWQWLSYSLPINFPVDAVIHDETTLYAGTRNGLFTSTDEGTTWTLRVKGGTVHDFAIHKNAVWYCGLNNDVAYSTDHGATWNNVVGTDLQSQGSFNRLFSDGDVLYIGTNGHGIYRTSDMGVSWHHIADEIPSNNAYIYAIGRAGSALLASTPNVTYRSTDNGATWEEVATGLPLGNGTNSYAYHNGILLAGVTSYGMFRSLDEGLTWEKADSGITFSAPTTVAFAGGIFLTGALGIYRSIDQGLTWNLSSSGLSNTTVTGLVPTSSGIAAGTLDADFGLVWNTTNQGDHWEIASDGLSTRGVDILGTSEGNIICGTDGEGISVSTDAGQHWKQIQNISTTSYSQSIATNGKVVILATEDFTGPLIRSLDAGITWEGAAKGVPASSFYSLLSVDNTFLLSTATDGLFISRDSGSSWQPLSNAIGDFSQLLGHRGPYIFAGSSAHQLFRSSDAGVHWQQITPGPGTNRHLNCMEVVDTMLYLGTDKGVYSSSDNGMTWLPSVPSGLDNFKLTTLLYDNGTLYAGTENGGVWKEPLGNNAVHDVAASAQEIMVFPNPIRGSAEIRTSINNNAGLKLIVSDPLGRTVKEIAVGERKAQEPIGFNTDGLAKGLYILTIESGENVVSTPVVIMR